VLGQINVGVEPEGMAVSPDGKWAVNTSETTNMLHWIDTSTQTLVDSTLVDQRPRFVEFNKDGSQLWASAEIGGTVTILDVASAPMLKTLTFQIKGVHPDKSSRWGSSSAPTASTPSSPSARPTMWR
jgi:DNA-binding beta-propeller fold protein YncE